MSDPAPSVEDEEVDHMTTTTIDCQTCPVRGRHCGDCFVPVLGAVWLQTPTVTTPEAQEVQEVPMAPDDPGPRGVRLDSDELAAVGAFVRAGLVTPQEASAARAELVDDRRWAAG